MCDEELCTCCGKRKKAEGKRFLCQRCFHRAGSDDEVLAKSRYRLRDKEAKRKLSSSDNKMFSVPFTGFPTKEKK